MRFEKLGCSIEPEIILIKFCPVTNLFHSLHRPAQLLRCVSLVLHGDSEMPEAIHLQGERSV